MPVRAKKLSLSGVAWLLGYLATMLALAWALVEARRGTLRDLGTDRARTEWQAWKSKVAEQSRSASPVARRPIKSDEPPALVLYRDYFAPILGMALLLGSVLFGFLMIIVRNAWRQPPAFSSSIPSPDERDDMPPAKEVT